MDATEVLQKCFSFSLGAIHTPPISAGHDLTTVAANITSANGGMALAAGNDIHLNAGQENHTWQQDSTTQTSGFLSSTTKTAHDASQDSLAVGTVLSGNTVTVAAGHDITTQAAQIVATDDVVMAAGNNLALGTATRTHSEQHDRTTKTSGVFTSGLNLMIGSSKASQRYSATDTTPQGSVIGSLKGGVTLTAGNGVATSRRHGISVTIVMPITTPVAITTLGPVYTICVARAESCLRARQGRAKEVYVGIRLK